MPAALGLILRHLPAPQNTLPVPFRLLFNTPDLLSSVFPQPRGHLLLEAQTAGPQRTSSSHLSLWAPAYVSRVPLGLWDLPTNLAGCPLGLGLKFPQLQLQFLGWG